MEKRNNPLINNESDYETPKKKKNSPQTWPMDNLKIRRRQIRFQSPKISSLLRTPKTITNSKSLLLQCLRSSKSDPFPRCKRFPIPYPNENGILMDTVLVTSAISKETNRFSRLSSGSEKTLFKTSPKADDDKNPSKMELNNLTPRQLLLYDHYNPLFPWTHPLHLQPYPYLNRTRLPFYLPVLPHDFEIDSQDDFPSLSDVVQPTKRELRNAYLTSQQQPDIEPPIPDLLLPSDEAQTVAQEPDFSSHSNGHEPVMQEPGLPSVSDGLEPVAQEPGLASASVELEPVAQGPGLRSPADELEPVAQEPVLMQEQDDEAVIQEQEVEAVMQEQEVEAVIQEQEVEAVIQEQEVEAVMQEQEVEAAMQEQEVEAVIQEQEVEAVMQEQEVEEVMQEQEVEAVIQEPVLMQEQDDEAAIQGQDNEAVMQGQEERVLPDGVFDHYRFGGRRMSSFLEAQKDQYR